MLRDGSTVHVRPTTREDEPRLRAFFASLSDQSRWFRYFTGGLNLDWAAHNAADPGNGLSLLALRGPEGTVVGHGTYIAGPPDRAEIAFAVADAWHGHGIATVLLAHLAQSASSEGIETFTATVLSSNHRMLQVFHDSGFLVSSRRSEGHHRDRVPDLAVAGGAPALRGAPARGRRRRRRPRPAARVDRGHRGVAATGNGRRRGRAQPARRRLLGSAAPRQRARRRGGRPAHGAPPSPTSRATSSSP